jgi:dinuclear metal center YbgI/SA1388 family protein
MSIKDIISALEEWAPGTYQESYDNSGLITGDPNWAFKGSIICLDSTEDVVQEAIDQGVNMIIAHHPILFRGLKRLTGQHYTERAVIKALKHDIAIYAIHTNLDNVRQGVNEEIADRIGLKIEGRRILIPKSNVLYKLEVLCPRDAVQNVQEAIWNSGAGKIGDYERCSFDSEGKGKFKPSGMAKPHIGEIGTDEVVEEVKLDLIVPEHALSSSIKAMEQAHPYEEVAHFITRLENKNQSVGSGLVGQLAEPMGHQEFMEHVKEKMKVGALKYTSFTGARIEKVALLGGSGIFGLEAAKKSGAQAFITSDVKYHDYFEADGDILLMDIGHYESEQFTQDLIQRVLEEKFPTFAHLLTRHSTNPVNYL